MGMSHSAALLLFALLFCPYGSTVASTFDEVNRMIRDVVAENEVLFIHGGGEGGYEADAPLAASLQQRLGTHYNVHYPRMPEDESAPDFGWVEKIRSEIAALSRGVFLVGHS